MKQSFFGLTVMILGILSSCKLADEMRFPQEDLERNFRIDVIAYIDQARNKTTNCAGTWMPAVTRLAESGPMSTAAENHSMEMKVDGRVARTTKSGKTVSSRLDEQRVRHCGVGDMVFGMKNARPIDVVRYWLSDRETCMKIMDPSFDHVGFGKVEDFFTLYVAELECRN